MKVSGRALELNAIFLVVVLLLISLQVFLHQVQKRMYSDEANDLSERAIPVPTSELQEVNQDIAVEPLESVGDTAPAEPAFVPNIRKSFPKRKAHYYRKLKKTKKNKKNKKNKPKKGKGWENLKSDLKGKLSDVAGEGKPGKGQGPKKGKNKMTEKEQRLMHGDIMRLRKAVQKEMA